MSASVSWFRLWMECHLLRASYLPLRNTSWYLTSQRIICLFSKKKKNKKPSKILEGRSTVCFPSERSPPRAKGKTRCYPLVTGDSSLYQCRCCQSGDVGSVAWLLHFPRSLLGLRIYRISEKSPFPAEGLMAYSLHLQIVGPTLLFQGGGDTVLQSYYKDRMSHISASDVLSWGSAISVTFNWLILGVRLELTLVGPHMQKRTHTPLSLNKRLHSPGRVPTLLSVFISLSFWIWNYRLVNKTLDGGG